MSSAAVVIGPFRVKHTPLNSEPALLILTTAVAEMRPIIFE